MNSTIGSRVSANTASLIDLGGGTSEVRDQSGPLFSVEAALVS